MAVKSREGGVSVHTAYGRHCPEMSCQPRIRLGVENVISESGYNCRGIDEWGVGRKVRLDSRRFLDIGERNAK